MADSASTTGTPPRTPRWVKISAVIAIAVIVVVGFALIVQGPHRGPGQHGPGVEQEQPGGPGRHDPSRWGH